MLQLEVQLHAPEPKRDTILLQILLLLASMLNVFLALVLPLQPVQLSTQDFTETPLPVQSLHVLKDVTVALSVLLIALLLVLQVRLDII